MAKLDNRHDMKIPVREKFSKINRNVFDAINANHEEFKLKASDIVKESGLIDTDYNRSIVKSISEIYNNKPSGISESDVSLIINSSCLDAHEYDDIELIEDRIKFNLSYTPSPAAEPTVFQQIAKGVDYVAPSHTNEYEQIKRLGYDVSVSLNSTRPNRYVDKLFLVRDSINTGFYIEYSRNATKNEMMDIIKKGEFKDNTGIKRVMNDLLNHAIKLEGYNVKQEEASVNKVKPDAGNTIKAPKFKM